MHSKRLLLAASLILCTTYAAAHPVYTANEDKIDQYLQFIKYHDSHALDSFLLQMPKGGDLHTHEGGASLPENLLSYATNDNLCINRDTDTVFASSACASNDLLMTAIADPNFKQNVIDAWSMEDFVPGAQSGHDHFFNAFAKYNAISSAHRGDIMAEMMTRAANENEQYLEIMVTADKNESGALGANIGWDSDLTSMRHKLLAAEEFTQILADMTTNLNTDEARANTILGCQTQTASKACKIKVRYLYQVLREQAPEKVFAQLLAGFEGAAHDARIVGINMVQPEDGTISMRDYKLHMQMVAFLHAQYPSVHISLHAGELTSALVSPDGLTFHIHDAVDIAGAERIGHGVDIPDEDNHAALLQEMAAKHIMVEINLSSNADILDIKGNAHPLKLYFENNVPMALSTDDEGISRSNLTNEYKQLVLDHDASYPVLKQFVRNSIFYSFLPGASLWQDDHYQILTRACAQDEFTSHHLSATCNAFLKANEKAAMQWQLEKGFVKFEKQILH